MVYRDPSLMVFVALVFVSTHSTEKPVTPGVKPSPEKTPKATDERIPDFSNTPKEFLVIVSSAGDLSQQVNDQIRTVNRAMRTNYARTLESVSSRIDPVIVVQFDGVGGTFDARDGKRAVKVRSVPQTNELAKCVARVPLDISVILAPYFEGPGDALWQPTLGYCGK